MSFQTDDLAMLCLGILGDQPPDTRQPRLPDGIHCRWQFAEERGFPWHGYYLFRRESQPRSPRCLGEFLGSLRPGTPRGTRLETPLGNLSSSQPLVFTEQFPPAGAVEVDLDRGALLRFDLPGGTEARRVDLRIGLRDAGSRLVRTCADFRGLARSVGPSPRTEKGAVFTVEPLPVSPQAAVAVIEQWPGSPSGLLCPRRLEIDLPCPAVRVDLLLSSLGDLTVESFERDGARAGIQKFPRLTLKTSTVTVTGKALGRIVLEGTIFETALVHEVCWECPTGGGQGAEIVVRGLNGETAVGSAVAQGNAGEVVSLSLMGPLDAVEISPGKGALVDLCVWPGRQGVTYGWGEVPGFRYPLCLPVVEPGYVCPGAPATPEEARDLALSRVTYGDPAIWAESFSDLHGQLEILVKGGPAAGPMEDRVNPELLGDPLGPAPDAEPFRLKDQRAMDLLLLASLHPAIAQMLGLYFLDASAEPGVPYDYLLLADPTGVLGGNAATALEWLAFQPDAEAVDAYLVSGKTVAPAPPVPPPGKARAYALPGATLRTQEGKLKDCQGNVGLWWEPPPEGSGEEPNLPVLFYPHRAYLGLTQPAAPPPEGDYQPLGPDASAVVLAESTDPPPPPEPGETRRSPEWPPPPIAFHLVDSGPPDSGLSEGWYSYRVVAQDLFGRHSEMSPPAEWYQWDPPPPNPGDPPPPPPWYYQPGGGHSSIHPFAVALLDKIPPPAPPGVEAAALDPLDRWVLQDGAYEAWRKDNPGTVGLRVSWRWDLSQMNQAPDTREFRIYLIPGRLNELPAGIGVAGLSRPANWAKRLRVVDFTENVELAFEASLDPAGKPLENKTGGASAAGDVVSLAGMPDLSGVQPFLDHLRLGNDTARPDKTYKILRVDPGLGAVTVEGIPSLTALSPWTVGRPARRYEIFLTPPDFVPGPEFDPSLDHPTVFAQIGVSAADDKIHAPDDPRWTGQLWGDRIGNEGVVGGPAAIYRVLQKPPDPPELPEYPDKLWATPADYDSRSFFTFRWNPHKNANVKTHVVRALDDSLFQADREQRPRAALDLSKPADAALFPAAWGKTRRDGVVIELNKLNQPNANYEALSDDALRILAVLPGNEAAFTQITLQPLDATAPEIRDKRGPDDPAEYTPRSTVRAYLDNLPGKASNCYFYRAAFVDGANNRSGLSPSTPPVYLRKVVPPRAPVVTGVVGGEREITLRWAINRESDLAEYRVYRVHEEVEQDLRAMTLLHSLPPESVGVIRPGEMEWKDSPIVGGITMRYAVTALDKSGNESVPSVTAMATAFDSFRPLPPTWKPPLAGPPLKLSWTSAAPDFQCLVQRRSPPQAKWENRSGWLPADAREFEDHDRVAGIQYIYRLRIVDALGRGNVTEELTI